MDDKAPAPRTANGTPSLRGIYLIVMAASAIGFGVVILLNLATPLENLHDRAVLAAARFFPGLVSWKIRAAFSLLVLLLISSPPLLLFVGLYLRPVAACLNNLHEPDRPLQQDLLLAARQRLLNLQFVIIPVNVGLSILLTTLFYLSVHIAGLLDSRTVVVLGVRAITVGFISSGIMFLWIEDHTRRRLIPFLFPGGRLRETPGAIHSFAERRLRFYYRLGSLAPMVILIVTLLTLHWQLDDIDISVREYSSGLLLFCLVLIALLLVMVSTLNVLIRRSLVGPAENILTAVEAVQRGDLNTPAVVVSNDELGLLGDAVNQMIRGLRERQIVFDAFGKYVTPVIRDEILDGRIPLDGELKNATVLFCDLRNFTPLVTSMPPKAVVKIINGYFEEMAAAIHAHGGLVLQYIGDEIEAVFGAPLALERHAAAAATAALAMQARLVRYNARLDTHGRTQLQHGIGITTGEVLAANIGSSQRLSYALVGDTVNLSSRLQGLSKELGHSIIISAATRAALPDYFRCKPLPPATIKGMDAPVEIFALEGFGPGVINSVDHQQTDSARTQ